MTVVPYRIARYLTLARQRQQLTQNAVAQRMGVTRQALSQLESGADDIRVSTLMRWAAAVGVDPRQALRADPYLVDEADRIVHPDLRRHALLTGDLQDRRKVMAALVADYPGVPTIDVEAAAEPATVLAELVQEFSETARTRTGRTPLVLVNLDRLSSAEHQLARECIGRARAAGSVMLLHADRLPHDSQYLNNTEWHFACEGNLAINDKGTWTVLS